MLNDLSIYTDSGRKAGIAANHGDWSFVKFENNWLLRAVALESKEDRAAACVAWATAYTAARRIG